MRSRAMRLWCGVIAWIAIGAAAFFVFQSEKTLSALRADGRDFDRRAREASDALSDLRAAQQAYVAAGQGVTFWMPKVAQTAEAIGGSMAALAGAATSAGARAAIDDASATLRQFVEADQRARDYLNAGQLLMAGDVIFTEGDQSAATAARQVEGARLAEHQALDASEAAVRRQEAMALAAAAGVTAVIVLVLGLSGVVKADQTDSPLSIAGDRPAESIGPPGSFGSIMGELRTPPLQIGRVPLPPSRPVSPVLKAAAQLCTDFACMRDVNDLQLLLARASDVMDAAGLIVWLGTSDGTYLQPVLAHGYSDDTRSRLPNVPRGANNAAAAAYRSGDLQIVLSRPGGPKGAIVAPILGARGCIGALSAEIRGGGEASDSVQALAAIVAAQLAGVVTVPSADEADTRIAASS
jgi:hypothetical protein